MNKKSFAIIAVVLFWLATPASAHRLDEYLQAATIAVARNHVALQLRLTPGVDVAQRVLAGIHADGDGVVSNAERQAYAERVRHDVSLAIDGDTLPIRLTSMSFPAAEEMTKGLDDIRLGFEADMPAGASTRRLTFTNHHESAIAVYLVNALLPRDPGIHVTGQDRNYDQSFYQLEFAVDGARPGLQAASGPPAAGRQGPELAHGLWPVVETYFFHGIHHILTGYDHLLFAGALVLAAVTLWDLVKVVTAFTLAHSITLTLAALNLVHLPPQIVEPLIAASIVFVAVQNVCWPKYSCGRSRLAAAFFFGLFHGLGFAGGLLDVMREMPQGMVLLAILGFSAGVEAGHQIVLLPLFGFMKAIHGSQHHGVLHGRLSIALQRIGSAGLAAAGAYYLCVALAGNS